MHLTIEAPFDMGVTFGLDDKVLGNEAKQRRFREKSAAIFGAETKLIVTPTVDPSEAGDDAATYPYGVRTPYGLGLRLKIRGGPLLEAWTADAKTFWREYADEQLEEFGDKTFAAVEALLETVAIRHIHVFLFALGVAYVRVQTEDFAPPTPDAARALYKAYEFGGYGDLAAQADRATANSLLAAWRNEACAIFAEGSPVADVFRRELPCKKVDIYGFLGIAFLDPADRWSVTEPGLHRPGDERTVLEYDGTQLGITGWLIVARKTAAVHGTAGRLLYVIMCCNLAWELTRTYGEWLTGQARAHTAGNLQRTSNTTLPRPDIKQLKQFAMFLPLATDVSEVSEYAGDMMLVQVFGGLLRIEKRQARIESAFATFAQAETDDNAAEEARRGGRLNLILLALTAVSLASVVATVIGVWNAGVALLTLPGFLLTLFCGPPLLVIAATLLVRRLIRG